MTLAASGFLLFALEPMVGKMVLPAAGGTPGVWNACLFFFQACLFAGALYARALSRLTSTALQAGLHGVVLVVALAFAPLAVDPAAIGVERGEPALALLAELTRRVALPALALSATTPLTIAWLAANARRSIEPYALYVASNGGSLAGLLAYPLLLEPNFGIGAQAYAWRAGHAALAVMVFAAALAMRGMPPRARAGERVEGRPTPTDRARWLALAAVPSSLTLGVTSYLSADVAGGPLLWVVPLGLYLASWMPAFAGGRVPSWPARALMLFATPLVVAILTEADTPAAIVIALHLAVFFLAALACHGRLAAERPAPSRAPDFHLWIAIGGALGGLSNALVAPLLFTDVVEYPLAIIAACALAAPRGGHSVARADLLHGAAIAALTLGLATVASALDLPPGRAHTLAVYLIPALVAYRAVARPQRLALGLAAVLLVARWLPGAHGEVVAQARSFFGVVRITRTDAPPALTMVHGRTVHGRQSLEPERRARPLAYYDPDGPLGAVFAARSGGPRERVAAIGLGTGAAAAYARPEDEWTFYEIDPVVARFAADFFSYLGDSPARRSPTIVMGDGRLRVAEAADDSFDLVILDAFGSDAIPTHLLTREALALYRRKLTPHGWLVLHLSSRLLDFEPLVASLARDADIAARLADDLEVPASGREPSRWAVMARDERALGPLADGPRWRVPRADPAVAPWTDDFSSLWSLVRWNRQP